MTFLARANSTDQRYYGVAVAIVTAVNDDRGKEGRVKVRFPWFDEKMESEWCRVAQIYAGNGYGAFFIPEPNDEVLVAFEHGDMRLPVILGGLYNGMDKPPSERSATKNQKLIRTKGRHEILLDDSSGDERVRIQTNGGHTITLDDAGSKITLQAATGESITLEGGEIRFSSQTVVLSAVNVKLGGDAASSSLVLGDMLLAAFNAHTHNCTAPGTPSGPPVPPMTSSVLSTMSKTG